MPKRPVSFLLLLLLLLDTAYSFGQHLHLPPDGNLAGIVMPHEMYRKVLADPFGLAVLLRHEVYNAPNRFFAHAMLSGYFKHVPLALQASVSPIYRRVLSQHHPQNGDAAAGCGAAAAHHRAQTSG